MTLTKADIVTTVYSAGMLTKAEAQSAVEQTLEIAKDSLAAGDELLISGFGKWSVRAKAERRGRNPQTGDPLTLPSRKVVTFRPSRVLKARVQGEEDPTLSGDDGTDADEFAAQPQGKVLRKGYF